VLEISEVELSNGSVGTGRGKGIPLVSEMNVVDFFVVGDQLGEDRFLFNVPNGAGSIDRTGTD
jgi:hypothetical protein